MSHVTITVRTEDGADIEVTESSRRRTYAQTDVEFVAELLDAAAAKVRAAYGLPGSKDVGRCTERGPQFAGTPDRMPYPRAQCSLNHGHTGAHHDAETGADWWLLGGEPPSEDESNEGAA